MTNLFTVSSVNFSEQNLYFKEVIMKKLLFLLVLLFVGSFTSSWAWGLDVIPGAKGFGMDTRAAYGAANNPQICVVTTLSDNNTTLGNSTRNGVAVKTGSLRACLEQIPPANTGRIIIFEKSGTINCTGHGDIDARFPYVTIAGQTAPSPGITIKGEPFEFHENDVLVQHIRLRVGDSQYGGTAGYKRDSFGITASNTIFDHVSASWALDEIGGVGNYDESFDNITFRLCIFSEALVNPRKYDPSRENHCGDECEQPIPEQYLKEVSGKLLSNDCLDCSQPVGQGCCEPEHSTGILFTTGNKKVALIGTLFAHNHHRNPMVAGSTIQFYMANNIIYNFTDAAVRLGGPDQCTIEGNIFIAGKNTYAPHANAVGCTSKNGMDLYVHDNYVSPGITTYKGDDNWKIVFDADGRTRQIFTPEVTVSGYTALSSSSAKDWVLANAGARPADRDAVDTRIVNDVINGTGKQINSQDEVGGWPNLEQNTWDIGKLDGNGSPGPIPSDPHGDDDGDGYTNLEEWLHAFAAEVEGNGLHAFAAEVDEGNGQQSSAVSAPKGLSIISTH